MYLLLAVIVVAVIIIMWCVTKKMKRCKHGCLHMLGCSCDPACAANAVGADTFVNKSRIVTLHHTLWCSACKSMRPIWESVKTLTRGSNIIYREVDEDEAKTPGVTSYPMILMVDENGQRRRYTGGANLAQLRNWISAH